ncbi:MAG: sensor histidine kinase [Frankiales bacterium]|nr:sensor histidine kinase [Frankiales bacterium]
MGSLSAEPCVVLGSFAARLADGSPLGEALHVLATGLPVRTAVVRSVDGELLGVGGEALKVMQAVPAPEVGLEFPVLGHDGLPVASLSVRGGRPSHLPALRAAAAVLGLALAARNPVDARALVHDRERELDELADALHDGVMQSLMVARLAADAALRGADLEPAREAVQDAVQDLRQLVWSLRPRGGDGLVAALEQLVAQRGAALEARAGIDVEPAVATLAYRVVQASPPGLVRVGLQAEGICVEIYSGLPFAARWARRAEALGCRLTATADHCTLLLPRAAGSFSTDVRTTS